MKAQPSVRNIQHNAAVIGLENNVGDPFRSTSQAALCPNHRRGPVVLCSNIDNSEDLSRRESAIPFFPRTVGSLVFLRMLKTKYMAGLRGIGSEAKARKGFPSGI